MREYVWVPEGSVKPGTTIQLSAPIPLEPTDSESSAQVEQVWTLPYFRNQDIKPPASLKLTHGETAILETISHDWFVRLGCLYYRGKFAQGGCWIAIVRGSQSTHQ